jgi:hypothetical protein
LNRACTRVRRQSKGTEAASEFCTAVSLHSHTCHSKETLEFLPRYIDFHRVPVLSRLIRYEVRRYEARNNKTVDFRRAYWTPPVSPSMVFESETAQIRNGLGLNALVSITDHDTIAGPLSLRESRETASTPISVEWSMPFDGNCFHIGVHSLDPAVSVEVMRELSRYTSQPAEEKLSDLFALLDSKPETLLVLNHPCCNFVRVGAAKHWSALRRFLAQFRPWIHAFEMNGMRPWNENQEVLRMSEEYDLPVVAGGDRHGCRPNTMLNLSQAQTWNDFVAQIRRERSNDLLVMRAYDEPVRLRELATAADVLRRYPHHPCGQRRFSDRIFANVEGYSWHPLSFYWDGGDGVPLWLLPVVTAVVALGSDPLRPLLRRFLSLEGPDYSSEAASTLTEN